MKSIGPEIPTIAERFVGLIRLRYSASCLVWALVFGPPGIFLSLFLSSLDFNIAIAGTLSPTLGQAPLWQEISNPIIIFLVQFYLAFSIRFMRTRIREAEAKLTSLLPNGEVEFHEAFGRVFSQRSQALLIALFVVFLIPLTIQFPSSLTIGGRIHFVLASLFLGLMLSTLALLYFGGVIGLYRLGKKRLKLKSFREDPKMGASPFGTLSLSLSLAFFAGLGLLILFTSITPIELFRGPQFLVGYVVLILIGLVMFFLPLYNVHVKMAEEKAKQSFLIHDHFDANSYELKKSQRGENPLATIEKVLSLDMADRKLQTVSTWPVDTSLLGKLTVIILSVIATLIARVLIVSLGL